jgi:hypothetical protein
MKRKLVDDDTCAFYVEVGARKLPHHMTTSSLKQ